MEKLKEYVDSGQLEFATLNNGVPGEKVSYDEILEKTNRQKQLAQLHAKIAQLDWDQRYQWVHFRRLKGNEYYKSGNFDQAMLVYVESLVGIDLTDNTGDRIERMRVELKHPITLNIATCLYRKQEHAKAILLCDKILQETNHFLPALYKKAFLLIHTADYTSSKDVIQKGLSIARQKQDKKYVHDFMELAKDLKNRDQKNQEVYSKIFDPEKEPLLKQSTESTSEQQEKEEILYYEEPSLLSKAWKCLTDCVRPNPRKRRRKNH